MSADNWRVCPQCHKNRKVVPKPEYGKVSEEEYLASQGKKPEPEKETLREDWDIGIFDGEHFEVLYSASCEVCGFKHRFEVKEKLAVEVNHE